MTREEYKQWLSEELGELSMDVELASERDIPLLLEMLGETEARAVSRFQEIERAERG